MNRKFIKKVTLLIFTLCFAAGLAGCNIDFNTAKETADGTATVNFLDVGQGDSAFIELPDNKTMLIDASTADCGDGIVSYIKGKGYSKIDYLVATHPHADHIGGMKSVVNSFDIGEIYMPRAATSTKTFKNLLQAIKNKGKTIKTAKAGVNMFDFGGCKCDILAPNGEDYDSLNNYSAVIKLKFGETSFLFMGDAEEESEDEITADVSANVLKVGHHGSSTSTSQDFLNRVAPDAAVISCGKDNSYGHPHRETLEKLEDAGVCVYRTDLSGTIVAVTDGETVEISTGGESIER